METLRAFLFEFKWVVFKHHQSSITVIASVFCLLTRNLSAQAHPPHLGGRFCGVFFPSCHHTSLCLALVGMNQEMVCIIREVDTYLSVEHKRFML